MKIGYFLVAAVLAFGCEETTTKGGCPWDDNACWRLEHLEEAPADEADNIFGWCAGSPDLSGGCMGEVDGSCAYYFDRPSVLGNGPALFKVCGITRTGGCTCTNNGCFQFENLVTEDGSWSTLALCPGAFRLGQARDLSEYLSEGSSDMSSD